MNPHPRSNIKLVISMEIITDIAILCQFLKTGLSSDRILDGDVLNRLHQEDFCQALGLSHELKYQADGGPGLQACFDAVRAYSVNPIKDLQQLMQWVFFNYLVGNMDAHAKNLSFIYQGKQIIGLRR